MTRLHYHQTRHTVIASAQRAKDGHMVILIMYWTNINWFVPKYTDVYVPIENTLISYLNKSS